MHLIRQFCPLNSFCPPIDVASRGRLYAESRSEDLKTKETLAGFRGEPFSLSRLSRCTTICRGSCTTHHRKLRAPDPDLDPSWPQRSQPSRSSRGVIFAFTALDIARFDKPKPPYVSYSINSSKLSPDGSRYLQFESHNCATNRFLAVQTWGCRMERCTQALRTLGMALDRGGRVGKRYTGSEWRAFTVSRMEGEGGWLVLPKWMEDRDDDLVRGHWRKVCSRGWTEICWLLSKHAFDEEIIVMISLIKFRNHTKPGG